MILSSLSVCVYLVARCMWVLFDENTNTVIVAAIRIPVVFTNHGVLSDFREILMIKIHYRFNNLYF